jgi:hypothetical protein
VTTSLPTPFLFISHPSFAKKDSLGHFPNCLVRAPCQFSEVLLLQAMRHAVACLDLGSTFHKLNADGACARRMDNLDRPKLWRCSDLRWRWPSYISSDNISLLFRGFPCAWITLFQILRQNIQFRDSSRLERSKGGHTLILPIIPHQGSHEVRISFHSDMYCLLTFISAVGYHMSARDPDWDLMGW